MSTQNSNQLLASLSPEQFAQIEPLLRRVELAAGQSIEVPDQPVQQLIFPTSGLISVLIRSAGHQLEVGVIGREGMSGLPLLLGTNTAVHESVVQVSGSGLGLDADEFQAAIDEHRALHRSLLQYMRAFLLQVAQTALANSRLTIEQRLARWLLMAQDRLGNDLHMTHQFLATTLGVRRPSVTVALEALEGKHAIRNARGFIRVVRRRKLEELAGASYSSV